MRFTTTEPVDGRPLPEVDDDLPIVYGDAVFRAKVRAVSAVGDMLTLDLEIVGARLSRWVPAVQA